MKSYTIEQLRSACQTSKSVKELAQKLNLKRINNYHYKDITNNNIDISHFCSPKKGHSQYFELIGKKFNKLEVIDISYKPKNTEKKLQYYIHCKCDCGTIVKYTPKFFRLYTCCHKCDSVPRTDKGKLYFELPLQYFASIKCGAKKRNLEFKITKEQVWELFLKQNRKCAITNIPLKLSLDNSISIASLDRIDSSKGYTIDNVQWVFKVINMIKSTLILEDFIYLCSLVNNKNIEIDDNRILSIWYSFKYNNCISKEFKRNEIARAKK